MIKEFKGTAEEWNKLVEQSKDVSLMQLWEYAQAKNELEGWKVERYILEENTTPKMAFQALLKTIPLLGKGLVFINRPVYFEDINDKSKILSLLSVYKDFWVNTKGMFLVSDLNLPHTIYTQEDLDLMGFVAKDKKAVGWATDLVDLSVPEDELRKNLKQKWRNCLNKSEKMGVSTQSGNSPQMINGFIADFKKLIEEIGFKPGVKPEFIQKLYELATDKEKYQVIQASCENKAVGSVIIPFYGDYALYLASGGHSAGKAMNVTYKLLWEAALLAKAKGKKYFDLGGVNEVTTPKGILHFKQGLSGIPYQWLPVQQAHKKSLLNAVIKKKLQSIN